MFQDQTLKTASTAVVVEREVVDSVLEAVALHPPYYPAHLKTPHPKPSEASPMLSQEKKLENHCS